MASCHDCGRKVDSRLRVKFRTPGGRRVDLCGKCVQGRLARQSGKATYRKAV
jgi:hypothetical protein